MQRSYKIVHAGHKKSSPDLVGLEIQATPDGFELVDPHGRTLGQSKLLNSAFEPLFTFVVTNFKHCDWVIQVTSVSDINMSGAWNNTRDPEDESDSWTAEGTGLGTSADGDARAASAN